MITIIPPLAFILFRKYSFSMFFQIVEKNVQVDDTFLSKYVV